MTNFNKRLVELQPYVISIRFNKGLTVIDTSFKDGWSVPKSNNVGFEKLPDKPNYYMLYALNENTGIDEILDYVEQIIQLNIEREMKYQLLQVKKKELEQIFKVSALSKCQTLKFSFDTVEEGEDMSITDIPLNIVDSAHPEPPTVIQEEQQPAPQQPAPQQPAQEAQPMENKKNVVTERDLDEIPIVERETNPAIEAWNRQVQESTTPIPTTAKVGGETFDLPPRQRKVVEVETYAEPDIVCKCDPMDMNQVCPACMADKY